MATAPVSPERIAIAKRFGLENVDAAAAACRRAGLPFWAACALLEKESHGRNAYGHDAGGALSGFEEPVDESNYKVFHWLVFAKGQTSNGVGPCQITWKGYFPDMDKKGLKPWVPLDNMAYGFGILAGHKTRWGTWRAAATRYNGKESYGADFVVKANAWRKRLGVKGTVR